MNQVSIFRLYLLRAAYAFMFVGLAFMIWPHLLAPPRDLEHMRGVVWSLLGAVGLLAALGIRYPLQMLPVLIFELVWKTIWLGIIGIPLRSAGAFTAATAQTWNDNIVGVVVCLVVIPWGYVYRNYVKKPGDAWRTSAGPRDLRITATP